MPVKVFCPSPTCDASYGVDEAMLGRDVRCKKCGRKFVAGEAPSAPPTRNREAALPDPDPNPDVDIPNPFGKYRVIKQLGRGGMGAVYLAYDDDLDRAVALKIPFASGKNEPEILERFNREKKAGASLERHPNFCPIYEAGKVGDRPYLAMAYVDGKELSSLVNRDRPMNPQEAARLVAKIALAMASAHEKGIIHRDLKPSNVMIDKAGEPIIMDFGLARRDGTKDAELTGSNAMLGTIYYMSPEQVRGEKAAMGPATDIYSLGVILYELITGRRPFEGTAMNVMAAVIMDQAPPSASNHRPSLDAALVATCHKAMSRAIGDRHASMREFAGELDVRSVATPKASTLTPPSSDRRLILGVLGGIVAVILGIIIYIATDHGTLRIEGFDPAMEVHIDGKEIKITKVGEPITVRSGEHDLLIMQGNVRVKAPKSFVVKRGAEKVVKIEFTPKPPDVTPPDPAAVKEEKSKVAAAPVEKKDKPDPPKMPEKKPTESVTAPPPEAPKPKADVSIVGQKAGDLKTITIGNIKVVLCWCPPGTFTMGSPPGEKERSDDEAQVEVTHTKGFWMMQTEMTQELYEAIGCKNDSKFKGAKRPVETVSYTEAKECAAKLTKLLRDSGDLPEGWEMRLPTEAQWEYAARAGTKTATPFGDSLSSTQANFNGNFPYGGAAQGPYLETTCDVASYEANAWGIHDTVGNVWEWTLDAYEKKLPGKIDPYVDSKEASDRVVRGGSWGSVSAGCRSACRSGSAPAYRGDLLGFRLCRSSVGAEPSNDK